MNTELTVIPFEQQVEQDFQLELVKVIPDPEAAIAKLKEQYMSLKVTDKASFRKADEARKDVKNVRVIGEKICDAQRADLEEKKKGWIKKKAEWSATVGEVEDYLEKQTDEWKQAEKKPNDDEAQRIAEEGRRLDKRLLERQQELSQLGVLFSDNTYMLGDVRYSYDKVREVDDEVYQNDVFPAFKGIFDQHEKERAQQEEERKEAEEKQRQEAELLRQQQEALQKEQAELKQERFEIRKERLFALGMKGAATYLYFGEYIFPLDDINEFSNDAFNSVYNHFIEIISNEKKEEEERKERERIAEEKRVADEKENRMWRDRLAQLEDIGWNGQYAFDRIDDETPVFTYEQLISISDEDFIVTRDIYNAIIADRKAEAQRKRQEEEEQKIKDGEKRALLLARTQTLSSYDYSLTDDLIDRLGEIDDNEWTKISSDAKKAYDQKKHNEWLAERQRIQDEEALKEKERLADMNEGQRWREWKKSVVAFLADVPVFTTPRYTKMSDVAREKLEEILSLKAEKFSGR